MNAPTFRLRYFDAESRPTAVIIRKWIETGELPGRRIGTRYYVDVDAWVAPKSANPLVARVLAAQS